MLYKGLYKCVLFMATEPSYFDLKLTRTFVLVALENCSCFSEKDKVTCGICHRLVVMYELSLSTVFKCLQEEKVLYFLAVISRFIQKRITKLLSDNAYVTKESSLEQSQVLLKKCKAARLIGSDGLGECIACLSDAIFLLTEDLEENFCSYGKTYHMDCVRHQLAITYCVRASFFQECNWGSQAILDDISSAMKLWSCIYSSGLLGLNKEQKDLFLDTTVPLLLDMSQLLALKGYIYFQSEVQEMILYILNALKKISSEECCALLWRESRLNHALCCIPFSANIFSTLIITVGNDTNSIQFWEMSLHDRPGSLLEFQQKLMCDMFIEVQANGKFSADSLLRPFSTMEFLEDKVQKSTESSFVTSNLFYILSEKCRRKGKFSEALKYSKDALLIRRKQLQRSFKFQEKTVQFIFNNDDEHKSYLNEIEGFSLEARASIATNLWPFFYDNRKHKECRISQWIVLGNYLESLMQVGVLHEMLGAAKEAECAFQNGLNISNAKDLPLGQAAFGSCLGEIYRKCHKWKMAEKTFQNAMKVFCRPDLKHTCKLCIVTVEATLEMRIGDLFRRCPRQSKIDANFYRESTSAFDIYMSAKEKLESIGKKYSDMPLDIKMHADGCGSNSQAGNEGNVESICKLKSSSRISKKTKFSFCVESVLLEELISFTVEHHRRSLMSRLLLQIGKYHESSGEFLKAYETCLENISLHFFHIDRSPCICSFINGHNCQKTCPGCRIPVDILLIERAALLYHISWFSLKKNLPVLSWTQCCCSSENLRSFVIGWLHHAYLICNQMPALLQKVSILLAIVHMPLAFGGLFSIPENYISNLSGSHWSAYFHQASLGTTFNEEHLAVLDEKLASQDSDTNEALCHDSSRDVVERVQQVLRLTPDNLDCLETFVTNFFRSIPLPTIVCISLLDFRYASILGEPFSNSSLAWIFISRFDSNGPPVVLLLPILSTINGTRTEAVEGSNPCSSYSVQDVEANDLKGNGIGITSEVMDVIPQEFRLLLEEGALSANSLSRVASYEEKTRRREWRIELDNRLANLLRQIEDSWLGPWKCLLLGKPLEAAYCDASQTHMQALKSMVDSAALNIRKEDYFPVDTGLLRTLLGGVPSLTNDEIEKCICCLLCWKYFKLFQSLSLAQMTLLDCSMEWNGKEYMHGSILSLHIDEGSACQDIIGKTAKELTTIFQRAASRKNSYEPRTSSRKRKQQLREEDSTEYRSSESFLLNNFPNDLGNSSTICISREPVVLVLDAKSQVLPWESMPVLRNQEVYRMPSVGSISAAMISRGHLEMVDCFDEKEGKMLKGKASAKQKILATKNPSSLESEPLPKLPVTELPPKLPVMDPCNAFYLLDPSGAFSTKWAAFKNWLKSQQDWKGKSGEIPTPEECILALQKHDLFIYVGHGSGQEYIPERNVRSLDYCAVVILMGCSSGHLTNRGDYEPAGVPLSYLIAGSPCIIANLWDVVDLDINRFTKALLHSWLEAESSYCNDLDVPVEFENLTNTGHDHVQTVLRPKQKLKDDETKCPQFQQLLSEHIINKSIRTRTGSCIWKGRIACNLPFLTGAAPVCYGIPTTIKHR